MEKIFVNSWQREAVMKNGKLDKYDELCIHRMRVTPDTPEQEKALREAGFEDTITGKGLISPKDMKLKDAKATVKEIEKLTATHEDNETESSESSETESGNVKEKEEDA